MADPPKNLPVGGGILFPDFKSLFSALRTRRTVAFVYGFMAAFVALTFFLAFNPSTDASSPWFTNIFTASATTDSGRSQFSSIVSYFFPSSSSSQMGSEGGALQQVPTSAPPPLLNGPSTSNDTAVHPLPVKNETQIPLVSTAKPTNTTQIPPEADTPTNTTQILPTAAIPTDTTQILPEVATATNTTQVPPVQAPTQNQSIFAAVQTAPAENRTSKQVYLSDKGNTNYTTSLSKKQGNKTVDAVEVPPKQTIQNLMDSLMNCDFFDGQWVKDESYPLYEPGSCSLIDEQFNCIRNGRPDTDFHKYRWKPNGCDLPRLNASRMLDMLRGKRLVFVGDSLNRNMWESLVCMLRNSVKDQSKVYEVNGRHHFRGEASYSFIFKDYDCTVEFFVSPFLVREWEVHDKNGAHETLRLDLVGQSCNQYKDADILVFNTGHWWTHDKTSKGKDYYQEGSHVYNELNVLEAFRKALTTWGRWVDANVNPKKSLVFFRGYSESHFSGGQWNSGGACDHEVQPIKNDTYLRVYPPKMEVLERVLKGMKTQVTYLNITRMTDYRKDGHPSIYRKQHLSESERKSPLMFQDCSHWCLPGVPDAWNEILYGQLIVRLYQKEQQQQKMS